MLLDDLSTEQQVGLVGAAAIILGAFLPWVKISVMGTSAASTGLDRGDGLVTIALAVIVIAVLMATWTARSQAAVAIIGSLASLLAGLYIMDPFFFGYEGPAAQQDLAESAVTVGSGLYATLIGGLILVFVATVALNDTLADDLSTDPAAAEQ